MRVGIVGAGRVGTAFALALKRAGLDVVAVASRSQESVDRLVAVAGLDPSVKSSGPEQVFERSDLILLSVGDDAIADVSRQVAACLAGEHGVQKCSREGGADERPPAEGRRRVVAHLSGALSSALLSPLRTLGASVGSLHPIKSFSSDPQTSADLSGVVATIEGDEEAVSTLKQIAKSLGMRATRIKSEAKPLYHAAACVASNYMVTLFALSHGMMTMCGMDPALAREALAQLVESTAQNILGQPPERALTGPIARGDVQTIKGHLAALQQLDNARIKTIYRLLGLETVRLAERGGRISSEVADQLTNILS